MRREFRALGALLLLPALSGCALAAAGVAANAFGVAALGGAVAVPLLQQSAQDRACANMSFSERQRASLQDRVACEQVWASGATAASMPVRPQPNPGRSCESFLQELEATVQQNARRPSGTPVRTMSVHSSDVGRCRLAVRERELRQQFPRAFEPGGPI